MLSNPVLITQPLCSRAELFRALAANTYASDRPAPKNLDAMADLLREFRVQKIICANWQLPSGETSDLLRVFKDLGVSLQR